MMSCGGGQELRKTGGLGGQELRKTGPLGGGRSKNDIEKRAGNTIPKVVATGRN